jgi:fibro-slime domain-containing protein
MPFRFACDHRSGSLLMIALALPALQCGDPEVINKPNGGGSSEGGAASGGAGEGGEGNFFATGGAPTGGSSGGEGGGVSMFCGDGVISPGEACDDGNADSGDGCTGTCDAIENDFACPVPGDPCVTTVVCGDGNITGAETCDDGDMDAGDGCSDSCQVEMGWVCPEPDTACEAAECGDGIIAGSEVCEDDDAPPANGDGCSETCQLEPGYKCDVPGLPCEPTFCGDGVPEGSEQCDDGNNDFGDGCTPLFCQTEPDCSLSPLMPCTTSCGDGILLPNGTEECEDGNTLDGDGCSASCLEEPGYDCQPMLVDPTTLVLPIVLRDFSVTHPDMEDFLGNDANIVQQYLGADGKPVYNGAPTTATTSGQANFDQWYRDVAGINIPILQTLTFNQLAGGEFQFSDGNFFPVNNLGFGNEGNSQNFHFTSEVRYWFEYKGTEQLSFTGDDDVWVFVNKRLAINLGGVHGAQSASITLDAANAVTFNLAIGQVYEIVVFQAERHTTQSNYLLTLSDFINGVTICTPVCGDGIKTPDEACDDGVNDGSYGSCTPDCKKGPRCGDNVVQSPEEECDNGVNLSPYEGCAPGCQLGAFCGDGVVDSLFGEACDDGDNDGGYNECDTDCVLGDRCGDGVVQSAFEECDDGNSNNNDNCGNDCELNIAN